MLLCSTVKRLSFGKQNMGRKKKRNAIDPMVSDKCKHDYIAGETLHDIAKKHSVKYGTVAVWKQRGKWEEEKKQKFLDIAKALGGHVYIDEHGNERCSYKTYSFDNEYEQDVPLTQLDEQFVKTQYSPDKETVEKIRSDKEQQ